MGFVKVGWNMENFERIEGFWGIWEGIRFMKGCGCVLGFKVFAQRIPNEGDVDGFGGTTLLCERRAKSGEQK